MKAHLSSVEPSSLALCAALKEHFRATFVLPVSRAALGLAGVLSCWRNGRDCVRVALPGAVCHEVVLAVLAARCEPVFCDVDVADGLVRECEWVRARSRGAEVAIVVHLYGNPAPVGTVRSVFRAPECLVVDDAAQALGSSSPEGLAGAQGDVGLLSFGHSKHIEAGNAALLFRNVAFAEKVSTFMQLDAPESEEVRSLLVRDFRSRFDAARARLCRDGDAAASSFRGLLDGMEGVLHTPFDPRVQQQVLMAFERYPDSASRRVSKGQLWSELLAGTGLEPVGMGQGCVPWRYVCRLPGMTWDAQARLAEALRKKGMHVSNWYLPAHWLVGHPAGTLPEVERLAREVFQFWLDETMTPEAIAIQAQIVRQAMTCAL